MYQFLAITSLLKTFNPYFRKHILDSLEAYEYLFVNTFLVVVFVFIYFIYKICTHDDICNKLKNKIYKLTHLQIFYFIFIAFITVISSIVIINLDKNFKTPLMNSMISKGLAAILLLFVAMIIYKEKYNLTQLFGVFLTVVGLILINYKN